MCWQSSFPTSKRLRFTLFPGKEPLLFRHLVSWHLAKAQKDQICLDPTWYQGQRLLPFYRYTQHTCNYLRSLLQHLGSKHGHQCPKKENREDGKGAILSTSCSLISGAIGAVKPATISMPKGLPSNLKCGSLCACSAFISSTICLHRSSSLSLFPRKSYSQINPRGASKPFIDRTLWVSPMLT